MINSQLLYSTAYKMLLSMLPPGLNEEGLEKYFSGDRKNQNDLKAVYIALIHTAQNYQFMPNVIQFDNRENDIRRILHDFDYHYVSTLNPDNLFVEFKNAFGISSEKSWRLWCKAVVESANFVKTFKNIGEFDKFVTQCNDLKKVPITISKSISGIGFALACNALKELGYLDYVKPDIHLIDICDALNICGRDQIEVFDAMQKIAADNSITPFKLDKVLWLVCSGNFYMEHIRVKGRKDELIAKLKGNVVGKQKALRVIKHNKDSNSDLQAKIEKIQIKKLEEKLKISGLGNDSYLYFNGDPNTKIKPDIYSAKHHIIGEVYTHLGNLKSAQMDKVTADILKLILFEEDSGTQYKKYYVVCDETVKSCMLGNGVISNAVKLHNIQIECFELAEQLKNELKETMEKQNIAVP